MITFPVDLCLQKGRQVKHVGLFSMPQWHFRVHIKHIHSSVGLYPVVLNENNLCFATSSTYNKITRQRTMGQQMTREVRMCPMKPRRRKQTRDIQNNANVRLCFPI